jgi:hypothetical protein
VDYVPGDSIRVVADALEASPNFTLSKFPVEFSRVANVTVNHRSWNFRRWSDARKPKKSKAASA